MTIFAPSFHQAPATLEPFWTEAVIVVALDDNRFLIDDGRMARQAVSCLILPEGGDKVLVVGCASGDSYVVHVLNRSSTESVQLNVPGATELRILQARIRLQASEEIVLQSLRDVEISAATGLLALNANNMFSTVNESMVESVRHYIGKAEQYLLDVAELLRLHGQQAMVIADKDVKVDAERISVG